MSGLFLKACRMRVRSAWEVGPAGATERYHIHTIYDTSIR